MGIQISAVVIGVISLILAQFTSIPQLIQLKKSRNSSGISLWTYIIFNVTSIFWVVWSFGMYFQAIAEYKEELTALFQWTLLPAVIMNVSNIFTMSYVLAIKVIYMKKAKELHVTELQLSKILLDTDKHKYFVNGKISVKKYIPEISVLTFSLIFLIAMTVIMCLYGLVRIPGAQNWTPWVMTINGIGAVTWEAVSWPQFIKSIKGKDTTGVSLGWAIFLPVSCAIMFSYDLTMALSGEGFNMNVLFSLIFNGMISSFGVLVIKIINLRNAKKHHMSEVEYTKKYLIPAVQAKQKAKQK